MAQNVVLNLRFNAQNGVQQVNNLNNSVANTATNTANLRTQLRQMTTQLQGLTPGTQQFNQLAAAAGQLRDQIQDTNAVINATAGNAVENLSTGLTNVASVGIAGFQGLASAQALFGAESEDLQKVLVRLQALAGLGAAVKELAALGDTLTTVKASFTAFAAQSKLFIATQQSQAVATNAAAAASRAQTLATNLTARAQAAQAAAATSGAQAQARAQALAAQATRAQTLATQTQARATNAAAAIQTKFNLAILANPIFLLVAAAAAVVAALVIYNSTLEETVDISGEVNDALKETRKGYADERAELTANLAIAKNEKLSKEDRLTAIKNINAVSPEYLGNITLENIGTKKSSDLIDAYVKSLDKKAKAQAYQNVLTKQYEELAEAETKTFKEQIGIGDQIYNAFAASGEQIMKGNIFGALTGDAENLNLQVKKNLNSAKANTNAEVKGIQARIDATNNLINKKIEEGEIDVEVTEKAGQIAADAQAKIDKINDEAKAKRDEKDKQILDNAKKLFDEVLKLAQDEELRLAKGEDKKLEIIKKRQLKELELIYNATEKTKKDQDLYNKGKLAIEDKFQADLRVIKNKEFDDAALAKEKSDVTKKQTEINNIKLQLAKKSGIESAILVVQLKQAEMDMLKEEEDVALLNAKDDEVEKDKIRSEYALKRLDLDKKFKDEALKNNGEIILSEEDLAKKREELNKAQLSKIQAAATSIQDIITGALTGSFDQINDSFANLQDLLFDEKNGLFSKIEHGSITALEGIQIAVETVTNALSAFSDAQLEKNITNIQEQYEAEQETLDNQLADRILSEEEYKVKSKRLKDEAAEEEKQAKEKAFKQQKQLAIVQATMSTAQAVIAAFASGSAFSPVAGIAFAAIAGALGAVQIGLIRGQEFRAAKGGIVPGNGPGNIDSVPSLLAPGEIVINSTSASMFPELLSQINQAGGGIALATGAQTSSNNVGKQNITVEVESKFYETGLTKVSTRANRLKSNKGFFGANG